MIDLFEEVRVVRWFHSGIQPWQLGFDSPPRAKETTEKN